MYPMPGEPEEFEQRLDAEELHQLSNSDRQLLERANKTITNLLRKEPIQYMEVSRNALIRTLEREKILLDARNRDLLDQLDAIKQAIREAKHGDAIQTLLLVSKIETILGED